MKIFVLITTLILATASRAQDVQYLTKNFVDPSQRVGNIVVANEGGIAPILVSSRDWPGVVRVAGDLQKDLVAVTSKKPRLMKDKVSNATSIVIIGTIGRSPIIDRLVKTGKLNVKGVQGQWESYVIQTVAKPLPGVENAIVIAGSDKRGTIYGTYELSEQAGVSPWYWWADVPIKKHAQLSVRRGRYIQTSPKVKYRGIFINDEAPSLSNWVYKNFGGYKHEFYTHVFELLLRLRANYLWPAMWNNCFHQDDPLNPKLADEYGIVMGTSHVEPMGRADKEWNRQGFTPEQWNYAKFPDQLRQFWAEGVRRNKPYETITTMAMRGKIDTPMWENENIGLLERIVADQRKILAKEVSSNLSKVPQVWCLYKEVQNYYDHGMRVPDDVTLLWADDNWGNIRRLPTLEERKRSGGAGVYYHFDYVGGPRNYKWIDTSPLPRIWEQMHMAYEHKADRIWIVNVGDIKPNEFPTEFFIRMGWDPDRWNAAQLHSYTVNWMRREFGSEHAETMADLMERITKYNSRRKPELLDANTYSLLNYEEGERVAEEYAQIADQSSILYRILPPEQRDAYFELLHYPIAASANLNLLYLAAAKNHLYAKQGRASVNLAYNLVHQLFDRDHELQQEYHSLKGGKWEHMMDQTHIGYTSWQQPDQNNMPEVVRIPPQRGAALGISVEGSDQSWPSPLAKGVPTLQPISRFDRVEHYFDIFNRGGGSLNATIKTQDSWLVVNQPPDLHEDHRIYVSVAWDKVPEGIKESSIVVIEPGGTEITIRVPIQNLSDLEAHKITGFVEYQGIVSIDASEFKNRSGNRSANFAVIPGLGLNGSSIALMPSTAPRQSLLQLPVYVDYPIYLFSGGDIQVRTILSPTQHLKPGDGLKFAISIDGGTPITVNMHENYAYFTPIWEASVASNRITKSISFAKVSPGPHTIRIYGIDPGVVLQRIIVDAGGLRPSYLGPPDSVYVSRRR